MGEVGLCAEPPPECGRFRGLGECDSDVPRRPGRDWFGRWEEERRRNQLNAKVTRKQQLVTFSCYQAPVDVDYMKLLENLNEQHLGPDSSNYISVLRHAFIRLEGINEIT